MPRWTDKNREATVQEYLLNRVVKKGECWIFGNISPTSKNPYPEANYNGVARRANIMAYEAFIGPIPKGQIVRHKCDTPACINPKHLELGTKKDNRRDFMERHPRAREILVEGAKRAGKGTKKFWDSMTPEQRATFIKERAAKQKEKYPEGCGRARCKR